MRTFDTIRVEVGRVARLTLNRPEQRNALSPLALEELAEAAGELDRNPEVRAVMLSGEGRAFSSGFDLGHWPRTDPETAAAHVARLGAQAEESLRRMRPITVAALHGSVVGGGVVLALACDLRVAEAGTVLSIPEAALGVPLGWFGVELLAREVGPALAKELILTGRPFTAAEALGWGVLNRVVPDGSVVTEALHLAELVAERPRVVAEATKRQVEAATRRRPAGSGDPSGALGLVAAVSDPDSARAAAEYLARLGGRR